MSNFVKALYTIGMCNLAVGFYYFILDEAQWSTLYVATATLCFVLAKEDK